jgi:hypothetical protein
VCGRSVWYRRRKRDDPPGRPRILTVAGVSKLIFIGLVLSHGGQYLGYQAGVAVAIDLVMVALFIGYLVGVRGGRAAHGG